MNSPSAETLLDLVPSDVQRVPVSFDINGKSMSSKWKPGPRCSTCCASTAI